VEDLPERIRSSFAPIANAFEELGRVSGAIGGLRRSVIVPSGPQRRASRKHENSEQSGKAQSAPTYEVKHGHGGLEGGEANEER
jgi:hypothetical protein